MRTQARKILVGALMVGIATAVLAHPHGLSLEDLNARVQGIITPDDICICVGCSEGMSGDVGIPSPSVSAIDGVTMHCAVPQYDGGGQMTGYEYCDDFIIMQ